MKRSVNLKGLSSENPRIKYGAAKRLLATAKDDPARLYPEFDLFVELLDGNNRILRWIAIDIIGHLARVDGKKRVDGQLERLIGFLRGGELITANHAISALAAIAQARPEHRERIVGELLKVEGYGFATGECRNIAIGKVILALDTLFGQVEGKAPVLEFVRRQTRNRRNATRRKAEAFLRRWKAVDKV